MAKMFLTTGLTRKVEKVPSGKVFDYQDAVVTELERFGMKRYYAQLSVIDFKGCLYDGYRDKEPVDVVAVRIFTRAKQSYIGKVMLTDGDCIYSGPGLKRE